MTSEARHSIYNLQMAAPTFT